MWPYQANLADVTIPPFDPNAYAVGATIYSTTVTGTISNSTTGKGDIVCSPGGQRLWVSGYGAPDAKNVYPTSMPGMGVRITQYGLTAPYLSGSMLGDTQFFSISGTQVFTVEFVKTGAMNMSGSISGSAVAYRFDGAGGVELVRYSWGKPVDVTLRVPTCTVSTPNINVDLGEEVCRRSALA